MVFFLECIGDVGMSAHRYQSNPATTRQTHRWQISANQASLESAHRVCCWSWIQRRCCVCTTGLKSPELRCSDNFFLLPTSCSPLLPSRHRINEFSDQMKDRRGASLTPKQTLLKSHAAAAEVSTFLRRSTSSAHRRFTNT